MANVRQSGSHGSKYASLSTQQMFKLVRCPGCAAGWGRRVNSRGTAASIPPPPKRAIPTLRNKRTLRDIRTYSSVMSRLKKKNVFFFSNRDVDFSTSVVNYISFFSLSRFRHKYKYSRKCHGFVPRLVKSASIVTNNKNNTSARSWLV